MDKKEKIINIVVDELKDKNADLRTVKMCVRIAINVSTEKFSEEEATEIVKKCADMLPFNPME